MFLHEPPPGLDAAAAGSELESSLGPRLAGLVRESVDELASLAAADALALARLREAFPKLDPVLVPQLAGEVEDLSGLTRVARYLESPSSAGTSPSAAQ